MKSWGSDDFDGQRVQALVEVFLQRIIHKAVLPDAADSGKRRTADTHPKMGAVAKSVGTRVAGMGGAFIEHLKKTRRQCGAQIGLQCGCRWNVAGGGVSPPRHRP